MLKCENKNNTQDEKTYYCNIQSIYYQRFNCCEIFKHLGIVAFYYYK